VYTHFGFYSQEFPLFTVGNSIPEPICSTKVGHSQVAGLGPKICKFPIVKLKKQLYYLCRFGSWCALRI
jgi:hypothetical protein